jgi:hypothetical protein
MNEDNKLAAEIGEPTDGATLQTRIEGTANLPLADGAAQPKEAASIPTPKSRATQPGKVGGFFRKLTSRSGRIPLSKTSGDFFGAPDPAAARVAGEENISAPLGTPAVPVDFSFFGKVVKGFVRALYGFRVKRLENKIAVKLGKEAAHTLCAEVQLPKDELEDFAQAFIEVAKKHNWSSEQGPEMLLVASAVNLEFGFRAGMGRIEAALNKIAEKKEQSHAE